MHKYLNRKAATPLPLVPLESNWIRHGSVDRARNPLVCPVFTPSPEATESGLVWCPVCSSQEGVPGRSRIDLDLHSTSR